MRESQRVLVLYASSVTVHRAIAIVEIALLRATSF